MIEAVANVPGGEAFSVAPGGATSGTGFAFVVISDTGEGDASQHVLRDRYLDVVKTTRFNAWPFSPEWLSAAFDVNMAPFFQSFVEVRVEPSAGRVRIMPYGVHGRLRWSDLQASPTVRSGGIATDAFAEWVIEMPGER